MLYIFYGTDTEKARKKVHTLIDSLLAKNSEAADFRFESEAITTDLLAEYAESQGLFAKKYIVFLDNPFESDDSTEAVLTFKKDLKSSDNIFIILAGSLTKTFLKKFEHHADKIVEVGNSTPGKKEVFNLFTLTDALGARTPGKLWVLYRRAIAAGKAPEEIHGVLWWQVKSMLLVVKSSDAEEAGLKPFVFTKSKKYAANFPGNELHQLADELIAIYHRARRGESDFGNDLEQCILAL